MKYSHIGMLKNRSLLAINPFNPLKNKILDTINSEIDNFLKDEKASSSNFKELTKHEHIKEFEENIQKIKYIQKSITVHELTHHIHALKRIIFYKLEMLNIKSFCVNNEEINLENERNNDPSFFKDIYNQCSLEFLELYRKDILDDNFYLLFKNKNQLEKIRLLKKNLNQIKLAERYYENAENMDDENLKLNLYYYFKLNFVKAYSVLQYYFDEKVHNNFNNFMSDLCSFYINDYNKESSKKNKKDLFLKLVKFKNINETLLFNNLSHGLSYTFNELEEKSGIKSSLKTKKNNNEITKVQVESLYKSAWFYFYLTESNYEGFDKVVRLFEKPFLLDKLIFSIIEFKSLNYVFNTENYDENIHLYNVQPEYYICFDDNSVIFKLKDLCHSKYGGIDFSTFVDILLNELFCIEKEHVSIIEPNFELIIPLNLFKKSLELDSIYKIKPNEDGDICIDLFSILCEALNRFNQSNEDSEIQILKNEHILTKNGYKYYLKVISKKYFEDYDDCSMELDLNMSRYLFLFSLSNEVRYYPDLLVDDSPTLKKYEYLKKEAGNILPKQFLYDAVGKILKRPLAIPFSKI